MKKNNKISKIVFFSLFTLSILTICLVSYKIALAAINPSATNQITVAAPNALGGSVFGQDIPAVISLLFNIIISASGAIFIILFLIGGIQYLFASGNEEGTGKAKKLLLDAVIGLIIVLSSWAIGTWVIKSLGGSGNGSVNTNGGNNGTLVTPGPMPSPANLGGTPTPTLTPTNTYTLPPEDTSTPGPFEGNVI
ncbi:MAG: pilin [Lutibacter sp.]|jgi:cbb3-type cytochrome oxidase subunit 3